MWTEVLEINNVKYKVFSSDSVMFDIKCS